MYDEFLFYLIIFAAFYCAVLYVLNTFTFAASIFASSFALHRRITPVSGKLPGVSIVKPLMGVDPLLEENIESHFLLDYPRVELLFCVHEADDPALSIVNRLRKKYPQVSSRIFVDGLYDFVYSPDDAEGGGDAIVNPMVCNMAPGYNNAAYDLVWISSSRIKVSTEIILDMVARHENPKVDIVHQVPYVSDRPGFAATLEKVFFGTDIARVYLASQVLGINCVTGMSYMVKKQLLDAIGGLTYYGRYLAEDYFLTKALQDQGYEHQLCAIPAVQNMCDSTVFGYKDRLVRWGRLRLNQVPLVTLFLEPLSQCLTLGSLAALIAYAVYGIHPLLYLATHCFVWMLFDYVLLGLMQHGPLPFSFLQFLAAWIVRELIFVFVYIEMWSNCHVIRWGSRVYRVRFGGLANVVSTNRKPDTSPDLDVMSM